MKRWLVAFALLAAGAASFGDQFDAAEAFHYRFSFPQPSERWMQVEATFGDLGAAPLELRISRSSPGRYALHDFARNVYDIHAFGPDGHELKVEKPDAAV